MSDQRADAGPMSGRRSQFTVGEQVRQLTPLVILWTVGALVVSAAGLQGTVPAARLFLDPQTLSDLPWYAGVMSDIGIVAWACAAVVALVGGWVAFQTQRPSAGRFLVAGGSVSALLMLDDMLLLHGDVLPPLLGGSETLGALVVIGPVVGWVVAFKSEILRTRWLMLASAFVAFEAAMIMDQTLNVQGGNPTLEDGAFFLGVLAWLLYFVLTTRDIVRSTIRAAAERGHVTSRAVASASGAGMEASSMMAAPQ